MLTISFLPYSEIENLGPYQRIKKILNTVKDKKILILEGRLRREEEAELIKVTMEEIDKTFKGIELAVIYPGETAGDTILAKARIGMLNMLLGDRQGLTIIGPATIVKEIKKDPNNIELLTIDGKASRAKQRPGVDKRTKRSSR
jgi:hypothetical protein